MDSRQQVGAVHLTGDAARHDRITFVSYSPHWPPPLPSSTATLVSDWTKSCPCMAMDPGRAAS